MSQAALESSATPKEFTVANPAAGANFSLAVPTGQNYKIDSIFFKLVTSAVVASRFPELQFTDASGNIVWQGGGIHSVAASQTFLGSGERLGTQSTAFVNGAPYEFTLPDLWLPAGYIIKSNVLNIDVGDQISLVAGMLRTSTADF